MDLLTMVHNIALEHGAMIIITAAVLMFAQYVVVPLLIPQFVYDKFNQITPGTYSSIYLFIIAVE
jgi:hypothetical protein